MQCFLIILDVEINLQLQRKDIEPSLLEAELYRGFTANQSSALELIYQDCFPSVLRFVTTNSGEHDDAKDIFQEAVLAAWLNAKDGKYDPKAGQGIGGYIFQIAKFKWLDKLKSKQHRSTMRMVKSSFSEIEDTNDYDLQEERLARLKTLYSKLDEKCRSILQAYYFEKNNLTEIGESLNHDAVTIKTMKYRCMQKLRSLYTDKVY